ncbi:MULTISPECIES: hypothetical protein [Lonepinella]|nr:hypothetical protein [Lonepinella koalarum]
MLHKIKQYITRFKQANPTISEYLIGITLAITAYYIAFFLYYIIN